MSDEFWPEVGIYVQPGGLIQIEIVDSSSSNPSAHNWQGNFTLYVRVALKPVFRQKLRDRPGLYGTSSLDVLHLRRRRRDQSFVDAVACLSSRRNPNTHACPCRFCWVIPRTCPFRIVFAASIQ